MDFLSHIEDKHGISAATWYLIGKGPSFEKIKDAADIAGITMGLNHVAGEIALDYWHVFDVDVFDNYDPSIVASVGYLVIPHVLNEKYRLPLYPHDQHRPVQASLAETVSSHPVLDAFWRAGKLLVYRRGDLSDKYDDGALIPLGNLRRCTVNIGSYSASTAVNLLAIAGVKNILLAGIDGGNQYAESFSRYSDSTLLDSGNESFDRQFSEMARTKVEHGLSIMDINRPYPVKVYVGAQKEQKLAFEVLAFSILKHASIDVSILDLNVEIERKIPDFTETTRTLESGTPFSYQRFAIPELMDYEGVGIYLDSDMQVFDDIRKLVGCIELGQGAVKAAQVKAEWGRQPQLSVLVLDASRCSWDFRAICEKIAKAELTYEQLFRDDAVTDIDRSIPYWWNSLEDYRAGETCLIHYTDMRNQPWLSPENKFASVWCEDLIGYMSCRAEASSVLQESIDEGWVRPGLLLQAQSAIADPIGIGIGNYVKDYVAFAPPHLGHAVSQLENDSIARSMGVLLGKRFSYLSMRLLVRIAYLTKLGKVTAFSASIYDALKSRIRSKL